MVKFLDGADERGGLHRVFYRATVGASGALTATRTSPSISSVTRTAAGKYTVTFDSTWVVLPGSADKSPLYDFAGEVMGTNGTAGTDGQLVDLVVDNTANQDGSSGPIAKIQVFPFGSSTATEIKSGDELMLTFTLSTSLV
jgi:hypothetical protein